MTFQWPGLLALLVLVPAVVAAYVVLRRRRGRRTAALAGQGMVTAGGTRRPDRLRHLPFALFCVALAVLVVALARPTATIATPRRQATVVLAVDVSNSMGATDVKPSRIDTAKTVATDFVHDQPSGVRIGVVAFGQTAVIVQPPTSAHAEALRAIDHLSLGGGTSVAQGLLTALDAVAGKTLNVNEKALGSDSAPVHIGYYGGATIVLVSDGENTNQVNPVAVARLASVAGVHIQTIGVGTAAGTTVPIDGFRVATALDRQTLQNVAKVANGSYHQAGSASALAAISKAINLHFIVAKTHTEITALFAMAAILLLVAGSLISLWRSGRVM